MHRSEEQTNNTAPTMEARNRRAQASALMATASLIQLAVGTTMVWNSDLSGLGWMVTGVGIGYVSIISGVNAYREHQHVRHHHQHVTPEISIHTQTVTPAPGYHAAQEHVRRQSQEEQLQRL